MNTREHAIQFAIGILKACAYENQQKAAEV
jgi:hypothetical protein